MTTIATITTGTAVRYHGSHTDAHGVYEVKGTCTCHDCEQGHDWWDVMAVNHRVNPRDCPDPGPAPTRWVLEARGIRLEHVRPSSFTPES